MSLEVQLGKVLFVAQEMELALMMAKRAPTDFRARSLARHVLIRAKDFIELTAALLKPIRAAGLAVEELRSRRTSYMAAFDEYFATSRTKLSAHVQDLEYIERLELWTEIEASKVSYFVDGAREIYRHGLGALSLASCPPWTSLPELGDESLASFLESLRAAAAGEPSVVRIGADMLSATRPQTASSLNFTPPHVRAAQLAGIDLWVTDAWELRRRVARWPNAERILRARLVTDVVSFADCLVTRTSGDPAHRITGLDDILRAVTGGDPSAIDEFRRVSRYDARLDELRVVRNHCGGHFDDDPTASVSDLIGELDAVDVDALGGFYGRLRSVFDLTCERTFFLSSYRATGVVLQGVAATRGPTSEYVQPFSRDHIHADRPPPRVFASNASGRATMTDAMSVWLQGGEGAAAGKAYFFNAFMSSPVVEQFGAQEEIHGTPLTAPLKFREAHAYLLEALTQAGSDTEARRVLELVAECSRGDPAPLALLLQRLLASPARTLTDAEVFEVLGRLPIRGGAWARAPLVLGMGSADPSTVAAAAGALYRRLMEDVTVQEHSALQRCVFQADIEPLLGGATPMGRLLAALVIASLFSVPTFHPPAAIERETPAVHAAVRAYVHQVLNAEEAGQRLLDGLLQARECVGICVYIGDTLDAAGRKDEAVTLFRAAANGLVRPSVLPHARTQARLNLAVALLRVGDRPRAARVAEGAIDGGVLEPVAQAHALRVLLSCGLQRAAASAFLTEFEELYRLGPSEAQLVADLRHALDAKATPPQSCEG